MDVLEAPFVLFTSTLRFLLSFECVGTARAGAVVIGGQEPNGLTSVSQDGHKSMVSIPMLLMPE